MQRAVLLAVVGARDGDLPVLTGDRNVLVERARQLALRPLHGHGLPVELHLDTAWPRDRHASDSAPPTTTPEESLCSAEHAHSSLADSLFPRHAFARPEAPAPLCTR